MESNVETRAGHVALVGRPNVGKSTLMNAFLGEKLSIVTPRPQTTREPVTGILTTDTSQIIFVDTPGLLEPKYALQQSMQESALSALGDADVVLLLLDATRPDELPTGEALEALRSRRDRIIIAVNKSDSGGPEVLDSLATWSRQTLEIEPLAISAVKGSGVQDLLARLESRLPPSPFYYPADEIAIQPVRFFVAELVRETIFEEYTEEIPYSTVVKIEEFREERDPLYIRATAYVERDTQKAILIGAGGAAIRELGTRSRAKVEAFLQRRVFLDLWVKTMPGWRRKASSLQYLGYTPPAGEPVLEAYEPARDEAAGKRNQKTGSRPDARQGKGGGRRRDGGGRGKGPKKPG
jgi:GTPase